MRFILLTGRVRSGKTTALMEFISTHPGWGGFLSPDRGDTRVLVRVATGVEIPFEVKDPKNETATESIGRFHFLHDSFKAAWSWLLEEAEDPAKKGLILDEIGKLELLNGGFHDHFSNLLRMQPNKILLIVVRDTLEEAVIDHYALKDFARVTAANIAEIS